MAPGQLKKLLNKQRKAQRKAQEEKAQALAAQEKRDMHKNRQQVTNTSDEADALPLDELLPEKLERVSVGYYLCSVTQLVIGFGCCTPLPSKFF
jgi:peptide alpha-N-acetyltransferase